MRIFLAINPPPEVQRRAWKATASVREASPDVGWTSEPKIHLTLKFLGEIPMPGVEALTDAMTAIARAHAAPLVQLRTIGAFPSLRRPRVIWMGIDPEPRLELLHHDVELACEKLGHELDGRPYRPHLTLGRVRRPLAEDEAKRLRAAAKRIRFTDEFHARSIDVMQSIVGPDGSKYSTVASATMRGG